MEISGGGKPKKKKNHRPEAKFRHDLDTCSKNNDLTAALALYESAHAQNIHLSSYHFNSLLHIISATLETLEEEDPHKQSATETALRIFNRMAEAGAAPTEATITTMARIAGGRKGDGGDMAFDLVKSMGEKYGATPKLRTYGPALTAFCRSGEAEKAFLVEEHMLSKGVSPEEQEIAALMEVSAKEGRQERVYEYLQKLRSCVGCVSSSTADILERWFRSEWALEAGRLNWDSGRVKDAILNNGGGWHGLGWLGKGSWEVRRGNVSEEGHCSCCRRRLACVDIDQRETEKFVESLAGLAMERETRSNFRKFQEWLDNHTSYKAVIDGANVSLYQQNFADGGFNLSQLHTVVEELQKRNKNEWPLVILHSKRYCALMDNPSNRQLLETWSVAGALYTTPKGSNDDWYWLYAAVKLKCLLVTNDEMRDHIFELLGRSFFPKWKERHQESETGSWHIPLDDNNHIESSGIWLCITRSTSENPLDVNYSNANPSAAIAGTPLNKNSFNENGIRVQKPLSQCNGTTAGKRKERSS